MPSSSGSGSPEVSSDLLRSLVLDYLVHHSYLNTARSFVQDSAQHGLDMAETKHNSSSSSSVNGNGVGVGGSMGCVNGSVASLLSSMSTDSSELETDTDAIADDEEDFIPRETLRQSKIRREIKIHILSGRIAEARELLTKHFPSVLDDSVSEPHRDATDSNPPSTHQTQSQPSQSQVHYDAPTKPYHLSLNLSIQSFIESARTIPLPYPAPHSHPTSSSAPSPTSPTFPFTPSNKTNPSLTIKSTPPSINPYLLIVAQKLWASVTPLHMPNQADIERYKEELTNVCMLLAYPEPERSPARRYLSMKRREAVVEQVNSAVVATFNRPSISYLELATRRVGATHSLLHDFKIQIPVSSYPYPSSSRSSQQHHNHSSSSSHSHSRSHSHNPASTPYPHVNPYLTSHSTSHPNGTGSGSGSGTNNPPPNLPYTRRSSILSTFPLTLPPPPVPPSINSNPRSNDTSVVSSVGASASARRSGGGGSGSGNGREQGSSSGSGSGSSSASVNSSTTAINSNSSSDATVINSNLTSGLGGASTNISSNPPNTSQNQNPGQNQSQSQGQNSNSNNNNNKTLHGGKLRDGGLGERGLGSGLDVVPMFDLHAFLES